MCERANQEEGSPNTLANSDAIKLPDDLSLSDSDPDDPNLPFDPEVEDLSSSSADEEAPGGDLRPARPSVRPEPAFSLRGGSSSFSNRSRSIFDCLEKAAGLGQERPAGLGQERPAGLGLERPAGLGLERPAGLGQERPAGLGQERPTGLGQERPAGLGLERPAGLGQERPTGPCLKERLAGPPPPPSQDRAAAGLGLEDHLLRDGVFARPSPPPPPPVSRGGGKSGGRGGVPDYLLHPERWTRYSLEDVPETSDRHNSMVAQQYIHSLQQRKNSQEACSPQEPFIPTFNQGHNSSSQHKIVFSRPGRAQIEEAGDEARHGAKGRRTGLRHPSDLEEEDEDAATLPRDPEDGERKRKRPPRDEGDQATPPEEDAAQEKPSLGFANFKKVNRKNFRKSTKTEED